MNIIKEYLETKTQNSSNLGITLKLENSSLYDVFTLVDTFKNTSSSFPNLPQNGKVSFVLTVSDTLPVLMIEDINIVSVKRKILNFISEFYVLDVLSQNIKIKSFKLEFKFIIQ